MISTDDVPTDQQVETAESAPGAEENEQLHRSADSSPPLLRQPVELTAAVIELALTAARSVAGDEAGGVDSVGTYLGAHAEDAVAVTAGFRAEIRGYHGWQWSVTLASLSAASSGVDDWTVSEVVLLPGDDALVAPPWVPWDRRVRGGDLGVGDLLPTPVDDPRLVPGYLQSDDPAVEDVAREFGLGRPRVLGRDGRVDAAERWYAGSFGPADPMAQQAPGRCGQCGFFVPLAGSLGGLFGACANDMAPGDGKVVAVEYGCGAHSEAVAAILEPSGPGEIESTLIDGLRLDEERIDVHVRQQNDGDEAAAPPGETFSGDPAEVAATGPEAAAVPDTGHESATGQEPTDSAGPTGEPSAVQEPDVDAAPDEDPESAAAPGPDEDAALQAVLELLPPLSGGADEAAGTGGGGPGEGVAETDAGVVSD